MRDDGCYYPTRRLRRTQVSTSCVRPGDLLSSVGRGSRLGRYGLGSGTCPGATRWAINSSRFKRSGGPWPPVDDMIAASSFRYCTAPGTFEDGGTPGDHADGPRPSRMLKREAVFRCLQRFERALEASDSTSCRSVVLAVGGELMQLQGAASQRAYLARSVTRVAMSTRRRGHAVAAAEFLEWAIARGIHDSHVMAELVRALVQAGDVDHAALASARAIVCNLASARMYASLSLGYAARGDGNRTMELLVNAKALGPIWPAEFGAIIAALGRTGSLQVARQVHRIATAQGPPSVSVELAMANVLCRFGSPGEAAILLADARTRGVQDPELYGAVIEALGKDGNAQLAQRLFDEARGCGEPHARAWQGLLKAYCRRGQWSEARRIVGRAHAEGGDAAALQLSLITAYERVGLHQAARRAAKTAGRFGVSPHIARRVARESYNWKRSSSDCVVSGS